MARERVNRGPLLFAVHIKSAASADLIIVVLTVAAICPALDLLPAAAIVNAMTTKSKPKKAPKTMEGYFQAIQQDLARMATKNDIQQIRGEMERGFKNVDAGFKNVYHQIGDVRDDVKRLNEIMVSKADLSETVRRELDAAPFAKETEVKELRERMTVVERKLGIERSRHAA